MPKKPTGLTGPISFSDGNIQRHFIEFPDHKEEIEELIAALFVKGMDACDDDLKPFGAPQKNHENDVDFSITCSLGRIGLELTEFAPLQALGIKKHVDAPSSYTIGVVADALFGLIMKKSNHYNKENRILVVYKTQEEFFVSPPIVEMLRRMLSSIELNFVKVYGVSLQSLTGASVDVIYPAKPHDFYLNMTDEQLRAITLHVGFKGFKVVPRYASFTLPGIVSNISYSIKP